MRFILLTLTALAITGCVATTGGPQSVRVVDSEMALQECRFITTVFGGEQSADPSGDQGVVPSPAPASGASEDAVEQLRSATAALGGNTLYLGSAVSAGAGERSQGDAYHC